MGQGTVLGAGSVPDHRERERRGRAQCLVLEVCLTTERERRGSAQCLVLEVCLTTERETGQRTVLGAGSVPHHRETGQGTVLGAQDIRGRWCIYPATLEARTQLLVRWIRLRKTLVLRKNLVLRKTLALRKTLVQPSCTNPFILRDETREEKPETKVWIDNVPISVADSEIEEALVKVRCQLRSSIKLERVRDADKKLTRFLMERRFLFITVSPSR